MLTRRRQWTRPYNTLCTINITPVDARICKKPQVVVFTNFIIYCLLVNPTTGALTTTAVFARTR